MPFIIGGEDRDILFLIRVDEASVHPLEHTADAVWRSLESSLGSYPRDRWFKSNHCHLNKTFGCCLRTAYNDSWPCAY